MLTRTFFYESTRTAADDFSRDEAEIREKDVEGVAFHRMMKKAASRIRAWGC